MMKHRGKTQNDMKSIFLVTFNLDNWNFPSDLSFCTSFDISLNEMLL